MSILVTAAPRTNLAFVGLDANYARLASPSWAEFDRLRSKKPLIVRQSVFRCVGNDKVRELRRKKRQWQHLHDAMDKVIDQVLKDIDQLAKQSKEVATKIAPLASTAPITSIKPISPIAAPAVIPPTQERLSMSAPPSSVGSFSSRSPTLCSEPAELPKDSPLKGKQFLKLHDFDDPRESPPSPSPSRSPSPPRESIQMGVKRFCVESETSAESKDEVDLACGLRLLHRKPTAEQTKVRRTTEWRHRLRHSSSSSYTPQLQ
jgi:hypothetical protein